MVKATKTPTSDEPAPRVLKAEKLINEQADTGDTEASMVAWYKKNGKDVVKVRCDKCKKVIAIEALVPHDINRHHPHGLHIVPVKNRLLSYRIRSDGSTGYSCECGADNLLLSEEGELRGRAGVPPHVKDRIHQRIKHRTIADKQRMALQSVFKKEKVK